MKTLSDSNAPLASLIRRRRLYSQSRRVTDGIQDPIRSILDVPNGGQTWVQRRAQDQLVVCSLPLSDTVLALLSPVCVRERYSSRQVV